MLINPEIFIEIIDPTQQNSLDKPSFELASTLLIHEDKIHLLWVRKPKCSIEVDVYSSQTTVNKALSGLFHPFRAQENFSQ